jgi:hypothetical protein
MAAAMAFAAIAAAGCKKGPESVNAPPVGERFADDFERRTLGDAWHPTADSYHLEGGALSAKGAYNKPLWLHRQLPGDAVIEFDCWSRSPDGDIKVELYGDGRSFDPDRGSYTSTGYVAIMGGWNNSKSILARGDEHGEQLVERRGPRVEVGRKYRWKIVRKGDRIDWFVDGEPFLSLTDPDSLAGDGHRFFAINNWQSDTWFDNLVITPAP